MNKTAIEWCDMTWNPLTGCFHNCPYCYARSITHRFGGHWSNDELRSFGGNGKVHEIKEPMYRHTSGKNRDNPVHSVIAPYPFEFDPTFHHYRLNQPVEEMNPQNIFVCSMADLFGEWVPDEWIKTVLEACEKAPQHRYLFLTKNSPRYEYLIRKKILPACTNSHFMFGNTITTKKEADNYYDWNFHSFNEFKGNYWINRFISVEPLCEEVNLYLKWFRTDWVIIGSETGNRKDKVIPKKEWIENIIWQCHSQTGHDTIPVFMKDSLREIWEKPLIREYPWKRE